jgi:hypothetical protein
MEGRRLDEQDRSGCSVLIFFIILLAIGLNLYEFIFRKNGWKVKIVNRMLPLGLYSRLELNYHFGTQLPAMASKIISSLS